MWLNGMTYLQAISVFAKSGPQGKKFSETDNPSGYAIVNPKFVLLGNVGMCLTHRFA